MYSISLEKAEPRSEEGVHKEGEETVIKLIDQEDPCTEILKVYGCLTAHLLKYLQA